MSTLKGFTGKLLIVNLTNQEISEELLNEEIAKDFLGGAGYCCRYLYDHIDKETNPLSPDNILMFMTGPFCGSTIPTSGRFVVCAKSPYTGIWGESNCGGYFGPELKKAGYDGIIIKGASEKPIYLEVTKNEAKIKDASSLWGIGINETSNILKEQSGSNLTRIACIGQAGENLIKFAIIASEEKAAGRTGMGAVMGSKKLKAITVRGKKRQYEAADLENFKQSVQKALTEVNQSFTSKMYGDIGTSAGIDLWNSTGEMPKKYWTYGDEWEGAYNISGMTALEKTVTRKYPCFSCPIGCAKKAVVKTGEYKTDGEVEAPEYEALAGFGSMILNDNIESIVRANVLCNDYGIDTISCSSIIALIYYLYDSGKISPEQIDGLNPKWGDIKPALEMIEKISKREGIGDLLAEGSDAIGKQFNINQDEIATVYGMEVPYHDLRSNFGMAIAYAIAAPRGPCHNSCDMCTILLGTPLEEFGIETIDKFKDDSEMAIMSARAQDYRALYSSLIMCVFANPLPSIIAELVQTAIGLKCDIERLKIYGERIFMIKRMFNLKMGISPKDDRLPKILLNPLEGTECAGKSPDFELLKKEYYKYRQWDIETGIFKQEDLKRLGLGDL
ncbi:MAG: aldehyde ferredoxin oxidoreductase family protein [Candidatus Lokiarchaeota archaeon]|nr:aldehyde ferredoxin oxidoreductase family protein [Candidatus Lokiarchaeota archaeon]